MWGSGIGAVEDQSWARRQDGQGFFLECQEVWPREGLEQWLSMLPPFNTVPYVVVTPTINLPHCYFITVISLLL